jgi:hypothetical protein
MMTLRVNVSLFLLFHIVKSKESTMGESEEEVKLNNSLNILQIMLDKGEVELEDDASSNATMNDALDEALNEYNSKKMKKTKSKYKYKIRDRDSDYQISSLDKYQSVENEESEEEYDGTYEDDTSEVVTMSEVNDRTHGQSTVRSNDIALGFDEEDSDNGDGDENEDEDEDEEEKVSVNLKIPGKSSRLPNHKSQLSKTSKRSPSIPSSVNKSRDPFRGTRNIKSGTRSVKEMNNEQYIPTSMRRKVTNKYGKKKSDGDVSTKGMVDKKMIERKLRGYTIKKDKIKKVAQQRILRRKFKADVKLREEEEKEEREKKWNEKHSNIRNEEKRRILKSNILYIMV